MIKITCQECGKKLKAPDEAAGKQGRCSECKAVFEVASEEKLREGQNWNSPSTGMVFVWIGALELWVGKYEVTNAEYRRKEPGHDSGEHEGHTLNADRQPVVWVNFEDAGKCAEWMTEQDKDHLPEGYRYRLPSNKEWTTFAQCGDRREYPWGNEWPPKSGQAGNYADEAAYADDLLKSFFSRSFSRRSIISDYNDGHAVAAPVDELWVNPWGLAGVGGNVWEACAFDSKGESFGAWRGASWRTCNRDELLCSYCLDPLDGSGLFEDITYGFRLVLSR